MIYKLFGESKKGGAYGSYYKYGPTTGIKVIADTATEGLYSLKYRVFHRDFFKVFVESTLFNLAHGTGSSEVVICKIKDRYYLGIKMPHFKGKKISLICRRFINKNKQVTKKRTATPLIKEINSFFERKKLYHHDLHEDNVILCDDSFKIIDFSPEHIQFYGKKEIFNKEAKSVLKKFDQTLSNVGIKPCKHQLAKHVLISEQKVHNGSLV